MTTPDSSTSAEILERSRTAWNEESRSCANQGCIPVDHATIKRARAGDWSVVLTPHLPVPRASGSVMSAGATCSASPRVAGSNRRFSPPRTRGSRASISPTSKPR